MEEIVEVVVGPWGLAAVLLLATSGGRRLIRGAFKETVKAGIVVTERTKELTAQLREEASDLMAEANEEHRTQRSTTEKTHAKPVA